MTEAPYLAISPAINPVVQKRVEHPGWTEIHVTIPSPVEANRLRGALACLPDDAQVIVADLFGTAGEVNRTREALRKAGVMTPTTSVLSSAPGMGGLQLVAACGGTITPIAPDGEPVGFIVEGEAARHVYLGGLTPPDASSTRAAQTRAVFALAERALSSVGMTFTNVARTWFYNDNILDWYPSFNAVRTEFFQRHGILRMPASTGIGAPNPAETALASKLIALQERRAGSISVETVPSPLQCDAFSYGSAFSRAVAVRDSLSQTLHISGTASIAPGGQTAHEGDPAAQIELTMRVVGAILDEAGLDLGGTTRAIVYFRNPADVDLWESYLVARGLGQLPFVTLGCHVCRDDLLFEIELEVA
jgi:enamine deaminase RidA (YjgF/YER057c/UK114 family)